MGVALNQKQVAELTEAMYKDLFHKEGLICPVTLNGRLTRTLGCFRYTRLSNATRFEIVDITGKLEISSRLVNGDYNIETITSVIAHELCHYHLYIEGSNQYGDGDYEFEQLIKKIGALSTGVISPTVIYDLICSCCNRLLGSTSSKRKADNYKSINSRRISACCDAKVAYNVRRLEDKYKVQMNFKLPITEKLISNNIIK